MSISGQPASPTPQPNCADYEELLPLLRLGELDETEETSVRQHVAGCAWCQAQLDQYDGLRAALRRQYGAQKNAPLTAPLTAPLSFDTVVERASSDRLAPIREDDARPAIPSLPLAHHRLSALAALAATLLIAILAGALFRSRVTTRGAGPVAGLGTLEAFPLPAGSSQPGVIIAGHDGALWFTEQGKIGRITPRGVITEYPTPAGASISGLAVGADGAICFADSAGKIGRLNPADGTIREFPLPAHGAIPNQVVAGGDGAIWFAADVTLNASTWEIGRITVTGAITEYPLHRTFDSGPGLATGPDGAVWFVGDWAPYSSAGNFPLHDRVGRISPTGDITEFLAPTVDAGPDMIIAGPDGALWYTSWSAYNGGAGMLVRVTTHGDFTTFPLSMPGDLAAQMPASVMTSGPDGNIWFLAYDDHTLWRVTPNGSLTQFTLPAGVIAYSMTAGPDGALWLIDVAHNAIVRLQLARSK